MDRWSLVGDFLNLGSNAPAMTRSQPVRALNAPFQPSTARPALVAYQVQMQCGPSDEGAIELRTGGAPPTTVVARMALGRGAGAGDAALVQQTLVALIFPGAYVELVTVDVGGAPQYGLVASTEVVL